MGPKSKVNTGWMGGKQVGFGDYAQTTSKKHTLTEAIGRAWRSH